MKKIKITYWIVTIIFGAFMLMSAIPDIINGPDVQEFMNKKLGYPNYIAPFLGVAKTLGVIAILIPGFPRLKEWAYAGLVFDLLGATYSIISMEGVSASLVFMGMTIALAFASYALYHKLQKAKLAGNV